MIVETDSFSDDGSIPNSPLAVVVYPNGMEWDLRRGNPAEHEEVLKNIRAVPVPAADPVHGNAGTLLELWR
jgi:uncharacterized protein YjlB